MGAALKAAGGAPPMGARTNLREYDPEWGEAFWTGRVSLTCDHEAMLGHVKVPVLFTHHFPAMPHSMHGADPATYATKVTEWVDTL
jgi:hypothetical protein